jgi:hypothetical protein
MKKQQKSMLLAGVPLGRGTPSHFEEPGDISFIRWRRDNGLIQEIHTPQDVLRRMHEVGLHVKHSSIEHQAKAYDGVCQSVLDITEDCRLHLTKWPEKWSGGRTPKTIRAPIEKFLKDEMRELNKAAEAKKLTDWENFSFRMRNACVHQGMAAGRYDIDGNLYSTGLRGAPYGLSQKVVNLIFNGREREAALIMQTAFFPEIEIETEEKTVPGRETPTMKRHTGKTSKRGGRDVTMDVIELPHTECIPEAKIGTRIATSGPRIHRPALRKPVLPQRLFIRRAAREPGGTILIDASRSMGSWDIVGEWIKKAPFATVAYYAGGSFDGWLYVYARDGFRAKELVQPANGGNTVDGLAIDWMLKQDGPYTMITDRQFCGAIDSEAQIIRLERLEKDGIVTVKGYWD